MVKKIKYEKAYKPRSFRMSDEMWKRMNAVRQRDKTWELFFKEILDVIDFIKKL